MVSAHRNGGRSLQPFEHGGAQGSSVGAGRDRSPCEVQRSGRADTRQDRRDSRSLEPLTAIAPTLPGPAADSGSCGGSARMNDIRIDPQWIVAGVALLMLGTAVYLAYGAYLLFYRPTTLVAHILPLRVARPLSRRQSHRGAGGAH